MSSAGDTDTPAADDAEIDAGVDLSVDGGRRVVERLRDDTRRDRDRGQFTPADILPDRDTRTDTETDTGTTPGETPARDADDAAATLDLDALQEQVEVDLDADGPAEPVDADGAVLDARALRGDDAGETTTAAASRRPDGDGPRDRRNDAGGTDSDTFLGEEFDSAEEFLGGGAGVVVGADPVTDPATDGVGTGADPVTADPVTGVGDAPTDGVGTGTPGSVDTDPATDAEAEVGGRFDGVFGGGVDTDAFAVDGTDAEARPRTGAAAEVGGQRDRGTRPADPVIDPVTDPVRDTDPVRSEPDNTRRDRDPFRFDVNDGRRSDRDRRRPDDDTEPASLFGGGGEYVFDLGDTGIASASEILGGGSDADAADALDFSGDPFGGGGGGDEEIEGFGDADVRDALDF